MTPSDARPAELQEYAGQGRSRGSKVPRIQVLLADEEDAGPATPPAVEPDTAENALTAALPHERHAAIVAEHGERAETGIVYELGVGLGELVGLLVGRGPVAVRSCSVALLRTPRDLLLALPVATSVVDVERPLARGAIHADTGSVEAERPAVEDDRHVVLAPLLLELVDGGDGGVRHGDTVVVGRERLYRCVAVVRATLHGRGLGQARVVVVEDELEHADQRLLTRLGGETLERVERDAELRGELLQHRHEVQQPAEQPDNEAPILLVRLRGHNGLP